MIQKNYICKKYVHMKKILLLSVLLVSVFSQAQLIIHNDNTGNDIHNGDVVTVSQDHTPTYVTITNNYAQEVNLQLEVLNIINTNGQEISLCFGVNGQGQCLNSIQVGDVYNGGASLASGASTSHSDIDFNHIEGNNGANFTNYPKDYIFKIRALNPTDNSVLEEITFTYRYDPNAQNIDKFERNTFSVKNLAGKLWINTPVFTRLNIYNLTGKKVKSLSINKGENIIETQDLTKGIYILQARINHRDIYKKVIIQ